MEGNRIEIFTSKKKQIKHIFYALGLIAMGIFVLLISADQQMLPPFAARIVGYLCLAMFVPALIYLIFKFFDDSPRLILDSQGLTVYSSAASPGFIPWNEIKDFEVHTIYSNRLLGVMVQEPEKLLQAQNPLSRVLNRINKNSYNCSFMISVATLDIEFEEFERMATLFKQKYSV